MTGYQILRYRLLRFRYDLVASLLCRHTDGFDSFELFRYKFKKHASEFGITSQWMYLFKADAFFGGSAVPANHGGPPLGNPEQCIRRFDYMVIRYNNQTNAIAFRSSSHIETFYRPKTNYRADFLAECARV